MAVNLDELAVNLDELLTTYGATRDQIANLLGGAVDGGPNGDGNYPVTTAAGATFLAPCPRRLAAYVSASATAILRYSTVTLMNANTTAADGALAHVYKNAGSASDAGNGVYQRDTATSKWIPAPWYFSAIAASATPYTDAAVSVVNLALAAVRSRVDAIIAATQTGYLTVAGQTSTGNDAIAANATDKMLGGIDVGVDIVTGQTLDGIQPEINVGATASAIRLTVYALGTKAAGIDTIAAVLATTPLLQRTFSVASLGMVPGSTSRSFPDLQFGMTIIAQANTTYFARLEALDVNGQQAALGSGWAVTDALPQHRAGWHHLAGTPTVFSPYPRTRRMTVNWRSQGYVDTRALKAKTDTLAATVATRFLSLDDEALFDEVTALGGLSRTVPVGGETVNGGLSSLFGANTWPAQNMQVGRDVGCLIPRAQLINANTLANWVVSGASTRLTVGLAQGDFQLVGYLVPGYVAVDTKAAGNILIQNCLIEALTGGDSATGTPNAIDTRALDPTDAGRVDILDCTLTGSYQALIGFSRRGTIKRCYLSGGRGDGFNVAGTFGHRIDQCYVRMLGQNSPLAHADCWQCNPVLDTADFWLTRNTFYMPSSAAYSEGVNGPTNVLNGTTQGGAAPTGGRATQIRQGLIAGNLMVGGGYYVVSWYPREGGVVENIVSCNNYYGTADFLVPGADNDKLFYPQAAGASAGRVSNLIFNNERRTDGKPMTYRGKALDGIWHYDRARLLADPLTLRLAQKFGLVDMFGHLLPGVENKTPFVT